MVTAQYIFSVRSGHIVYISKIIKVVEQLMKESSDNKRLSLLKSTIKEQYEMYKRETALCLEQLSQKSLQEIKLYDQIFVEKISKVLF